MVGGERLKVFVYSALLSACVDVLGTKLVTH